MADNSVRSATLTFGGTEYTVSMSVHDGSQLSVQVEERTSSEQWRNTFDVNCQYFLFVAFVISVFLSRDFFGYCIIIDRATNDVIC